MNEEYPEIVPAGLGSGSKCDIYNCHRRPAWEVHTPRGMWLSFCLEHTEKYCSDNHIPFCPEKTE